MEIDFKDPAIVAKFMEWLAQQQAQVAALSQVAVPAQVPMPVVPSVPTNSVRAQTTCPHPSDITLAQATLINNGDKQTRKSYEAEFKMCVELWTNPVNQIRLSDPQWKRNIILINTWEFGTRADKLHKSGSISDTYHLNLKQAWNAVPHELRGRYIGLIGDKGSKDPNGTNRKGTNYYDNQFIVVAMDATNKPTELNLFAPEPSGEVGGFDMFHFEKTMANGSPLTGKYTYQTRLDRCGYGNNWATEPQTS